MKKDNLLIIIAFVLSLLSLLFIIQPVSALTANSSSYSVHMFGTGLVTSDPSSVNYNSTSLSEATATTRNALSGSYTVNVGFFNNTLPHETVNLNSYSLSTRSAYIGSTLILSIAATHAQSTWAKITLPDTSITILNLNNNGNTNYIPPQTGDYSVTFYANSSSGGLTSALDGFSIFELPIAPPVSPGGGGGSGVITNNCNYVWECNAWSICSSGQQIRNCTESSGTCKTIRNKPEEIRNCSEALFDVSLNIGQVEITEDEKLGFNVDLIQTKNIEKIDVQVRYSIFNIDNQEIFSQIETLAVENNLSYKKNFTDIKINAGNYTLKVEILYGALQRASAEQTFSVMAKEQAGVTENEKENSEKKQRHKILLPILIGLGIIILIAFIITLIKVLRKEKDIDDLIKEGKEFIQTNQPEKAAKEYDALRKLYESRYRGKPSVYNKIYDYYNFIKNKYW